jgi:hypothetical protein
MWATIGAKRLELDFTKCEIIITCEQKIIALHFIDLYFARTFDIGLTLALGLGSEM